MRGLWVLILATWCLVTITFQSLTLLILNRRHRIAGAVGSCIASALEQMGGAFLKGGQILSTRADILPNNTVRALSRLRDQAWSLRFSDVQQALDGINLPGCEPQVLTIDPKPLASATIAQVHVGVDRRTGLAVAVKVRRPGIARLLRTDVSYIRFFAGMLARLPWFGRFPIREAMDEVCSALLSQSDFKAEVEMLRRFGKLFFQNPRVRVPNVSEELCTDDVIVMEYLAGYCPIQDFRSRDEIAKAAVQTGLRALYRMIFEAGLIHCDLHAGNILAKEDGTIALLDFGFVAELTAQAKHNFAEFFLSIAFRDGKTAARIVRETAIRVEKQFDPMAFEKDMQALVERIAGRRAADFQVAGFVLELFQVQRKHGIFGSPDFTLPILSLLTYEGLIKEICPEIDFQQEAVPFVMAALAPTG